MGFPISRPIEHGPKSIPIRLPTTSMLGHSSTTTGGPREMNAPEKKPYNTEKTTKPAEFCIGIQIKARMVDPRQQTAIVVVAPSLSAM